MLAITAHWFRKADHDRMDQLGHMLGTEWTREQVEVFGKKPTAKERFNNLKREDVRIPLTLAIRPELQETLTKMFAIGEKNGAPMIAGGEFAPKMTEEVIELGEVSKDQFLALANRSGMSTANAPAAPRKASKPSQVPEKVRKMQEQIAMARQASSRARR